jgi:hypothetical protein
LSEDDPEINSSPELAAHGRELMEDAKRVANGNFKLVDENGRDACSDSDSEGDGTDDSKDMPNDAEGRH